MPLRTTEYMLRVWKEFVRANPAAKRLPVVLSVVVHHGAKRWRGARTLHGLVDPLVRKVPELRELVPNARILVDDVRALDDDAIRARTSLVPLQVALWLLRDGRARRALHASMPQWLPIVWKMLGLPGPVHDAGAFFLRYFFQVAGREAHVAYRTLLDQTDLEPAMRKESMTIAEMLIEQGVKQGVKQGLEQGVKQGLEQGVEVGRAEEARNAVVRILARRGLQLSRAVRARIEACTDLATLEVMIDRAVTAAHADELFTH